MPGSTQIKKTVRASTRGHARTEGLLIMTLADRLPGAWASGCGKCIHPADAGGRPSIGAFAPETRSERQRTVETSKVFRTAASTFFAFVLPERRRERRRRRRVNGREKFCESRRDTSRAKILPGIYLGPSSRGVSEGSPPVVTACHVGSLKGQRHPEEL